MFSPFITISPFTQISPSPSAVTFSNFTSQHGKITPTVELSLNCNLLTLTNGEHSVIPYPFNKVIPISLKNFPISGLIGAPPHIISLKFPPKAW